jgi:SAM-dependent methyltransferase
VDQATTLEELLHCDTSYSAGSLVLEAGCGVGAQTVALASRSPQASFTSIDISDEFLAQARKRVADAGFRNVLFQKADVFNLPFVEESFDHVFVCFLLEHLAEPERALRCLARVLKKGGTITVIEGDHGSAYFYPDSEYAHRAIECQVRLQKRGGGDACIGRQLYPLLTGVGREGARGEGRGSREEKTRGDEPATQTAGKGRGARDEKREDGGVFSDVHVSPRMVYVDSSRPQLVDGFTRKTFTAMIEGVREEAINAGMMDAQTFDRGIADLYRTAEADGVFCYTFFKATALKK